MPHDGPAVPFVSERVMQKLTQKHNVSVSEIIEAFANRRGPSLMDKREQHQSNPPTRWFISETDMGRKLKVVYIPTDKGPEVKTAYPANAIELEIYQKVAKVCF